MLSGHKRYAHMAALRADGVLPELLGLTRVDKSFSSDALMRECEARGLPLFAQVAPDK